MELMEARIYIAILADTIAAADHLSKSLGMVFHYNLSHCAVDTSAQATVTANTMSTAQFGHALLSPGPVKQVAKRYR